jgi:hypothetical protein
MLPYMPLGGINATLAQHPAACQAASVWLRIAIDRQFGECGFDPIAGKHQLFLMKRFAR